MIEITEGLSGKKAFGYILGFIVSAVLTPFIPFFAISAIICFVKLAIDGSKMLPYAFFTGSFAFYYIFAGNINIAIFYMVLIFPAAVCLTLMFKMNKSFYSIVLITSAVSSASILAYIAAFIYIRGGSLDWNGITVAFGDFYNSIKNLMNDSIILYEKTMPEIAKQIKEEYPKYIEFIRVSIIPIIPSSIIAMVISVTAFITLLLKNMFAYSPNINLIKIGRFSSFRPDRITGIIAIIIYLGASLTNADNLGIAMQNINQILLGYFMVAGFAYVSFILTVRKVTRIKKLVIYSLIILLSVIFPFVISFIGIIESITQTRNKVEKLLRSIEQNSGQTTDITELYDIVKKKSETNEQKQEAEKKWYERDEYNKPAEEYKKRMEREEKEKNAENDKKE